MCRPALKLALSVLLFIMLTGCAFRWQPALDEVRPARQSGVSNTLLQEAERCFNAAASGPEIERCLNLYKEVLAENPGNYQALVKASTLHILLGTAFTKNSYRKSDHFMLAMKYAELGMYTNQAFYRRVSSGEAPWQAVDALGADEVEAIFFWVTALQYEFKEGMSLPSKIINVGWMEHALVMLERIEALAPDFGGGGVEFAKVICYYALPESKGGSKEIGDRLMQEAVSKGQNWLLPRWARGKYYHAINNNPEARRLDLQWVASRSLESFVDPYPWRMHFQHNAQELLR